jgi:hypothetical protein
MPLAWKIQLASGVMIDRFAGTKIQVARASALAVRPPRLLVSHAARRVIA